MITAALDCSAGSSLAIARDGNLLFSASLPNSGRESDRALSPWILETFRKLDLKVTDVERWSAGTGPGSFAGLRCGIALLKGICQGRNVQLRGIPSCYALAKGIQELKPDMIIGTLHDGRCGQVILTRFKVSKELEPVWFSDPAPLFPEELLQKDHACDVFTALKNATLPEFPDAVNELFQSADSLNAAFLLKGEAQWPWPDRNNPDAVEASCQPLYVRQAVFVNPTQIRQ